MINNKKLNIFLKNISTKKQYINKLKTNILDLTEYDKKIVTKLYKKSDIKIDYLIKYIIDITFSKTNTLLHVMDFSGKLKYFISSGQLQFKGKEKKVRQLIIKKFYKILILKLPYLKNQPIAIHLKNVGSSKFWILKLLKKKLFIKVIKLFRNYPYNGCRKKKVRRKKIRTKSNKRRNG